MYFYFFKYNKKNFKKSIITAVYTLKVDNPWSANFNFDIYYR
eukprot:SAG31_NODE_533_length_14371_cov_6.455367_5_plen_42_part_00